MRPDKPILFVTTGLNYPGGLERIVCSLANHLLHHGYQVSMLVAADSKDSFYPLDPAIKIKTTSLDFGTNPERNYLLRKLDFLVHCRRFKKEVLQIDPAFVITTDQYFTVAAFYSGLYKKVNCIYWQHGIFDSPMSALWRRFMNKSIPHMAAIVTLNKTEQQHYLDFNAQSVVIPNFTALVQESADLSATRILTFAQLAMHKGIDMLLEVAGELLPQHPGWTWKLIGEGPMQEEVEQFIRKHHLEKQLLLQAPQGPDLVTEYRNSSIYVMTSRKELFGMVLLEALGYGLPVVAFDCPSGPGYLVQDGVNGRLLPHEDVPAMKAALEELMNAPDKRMELASRAKASVTKFEADNVLPKWIALFESLAVRPL